MPTTESKTAAARQKQSQASKRATLDMLKSKQRATSEFTIYMKDGDEQVELTIVFQSIGAREYDRLVSKHPPKAEQRAEGSSFDINTFAPALISACSVDPEISPTEAKNIWDSEEWSRGDLMVLFREAVDINNRGIDIPFNANG